MTSSTVPIADLSYRNYDGPLRSRVARWWVVAAATLRMTAKKPAFWIVVAISVLPFLGHGFLLYLQSQLGMQQNPLMQTEPKERWALTVFQSLNGDINSICLLLIALTAGAGSIAADNRANALQVYLAKPITKGDYLFGKWMGVFLALFGVGFVLSLLLYVFLALSFFSDGFFKDDPWLIVHLTLAAMIPAVIHTSLLLGVSAWSKSASVAGAIYASVYFACNIIVGSVVGPLLFKDDVKASSLVQHFSIGGVIDGLSQNVLRVTFRDFFRMGEDGMPAHIAPPALSAMLGLGVTLVVVSLVAARLRIRAVEVVQG